MGAAFNPFGAECRKEVSPRPGVHPRDKGLKGMSLAAQSMEPRLVVLSRGPELYSTRRLATEAEKVGWDVSIIDPLALTIVVDEEGGRVFHRGWPVQCEALIPRIGYSITRRGVAIVRQFEQMGVIVMNSSNGIVRSRDKLVACQMMAEKGVPVPITAHVGAWEDTERAVRRVGGTPCVVKSTEGTHGSGVYLVKSSRQARQLVYQMLERGMRPLVQEYIEESHGSDVRALVVGGEVVASMRRKAHGSEFRSNFHLGGSVSNIELNEEQSEIAIRATETMGLEIAGVDMLLSERGPLVLEVNSSPGLEGIEAATRSNVAGKVAERLSALYTPPEESAARPGDLEGEAGERGSAY
tara:strand:+ start:4487 stop:5548 length:1062 start_codon:yes stop_codon:yes gene_type:complete